MQALVITPPVVQLNSPYPSGAYLKAFFEGQGIECTWADFSIGLFYEIFSRAGLEKLFELSRPNAEKLALKAQSEGDEATAYNLRHYVSTSELWCDWIDTIVAILRGQAREKAHEFLFSPFVPRGNRMDNYLANLEHEPTVDDVRFLCSLALADLADYITVAFDQNFSLIRYAESVAADDRTFAELGKQLSSPILEHFYKPFLEKYFGGCASLPLSAGLSGVPVQGLQPPYGVRSAPLQSLTLVLISVPFAGTYLPALYTARFLKEKFGTKVYISIGGGYVNTELRDFKNPSLAKYANALSFDRGYGSYKALLDSGMRVANETAVRNSRGAVENETTVRNPSAAVANNSPQPLYKLRQFFSDGTVVEPLCLNGNSKEILSQNLKEIIAFENQTTAEIVPDYSDIDFSIYPRVCDDKNPMHRLWTDGAWIKAYLAHGCYWHKCAFCDTKLDYVCGYKTVNTQKLYEGLYNTAKQKNVYGIHFVDEALPPRGLKKFALLNCSPKKDLSSPKLFFWGNIRFEKTFTKDLAAFLAYGGLGGVSAGIEVATKTGLKNINKGTDIETIVAACAALKEAGILVHAYMIYGFWYDTPQSIIDSMETLRQFFEAGLLDSAFWHKFMLTKKSEAYEKLKSTWKGGKEFEKFGAPLEAALDAWMHGQKLETKVQRWFDFPVPQPAIPKDFVEKAIEKYEQKSNLVSEKIDFENVYFIGSRPVSVKNKLTWFYLMEQEEITVQDSKFAEALCGLSPSAEIQLREKAVKYFENNEKASGLLKKLHNKGIVFI